MARLQSYVFLLLLGSAGVSADRLTVEQVPTPLKSWVHWVLYEHSEQNCPFVFNDFATKHCSWPGRLNLYLNQGGGVFSINWRIYATNRVELPGGLNYWPQKIKVNNQAAVVHEFKGKPALWLEPGNYRINGRFNWDRPPDRLTIPKTIGLIGLKWDGKIVDFPDIAKGELRLNRAGQLGSSLDNSNNALAIKVYRRIIDDVPLLMEVRLEIDVSGEHREILLGKLYSTGFYPLSITSPIPVRLEADGRLRMQLRPGQWVVDLTVRNLSPLTTLEVPRLTNPLPGEEIWVFDARRFQRVVEIQGVPPIDPTHTNLPQQWKILPAFRVRAGDVMRLEVIRRGNQDPEPNKLSLKKTLWLDFDGDGFTVKDTIQGTLTQGWRLIANPEMKLGRVLVDGKPQLITLASDSKEEGVEVRKGIINFSADSRIDGRQSRLDATGWRQDFKRVNTHLNLPPGWRLFSVRGVDNNAETWINQWSLLDLFLVLIIAFASGKLWGKGWILVALVTLALVWHESGAPQYVWLNILAPVALLRVVPQGKLCSSLTLYRNISIAALILISIPFMVDRIRNALHPQLELSGKQSFAISGLQQSSEIPSPLLESDVALMMENEKPLHTNRGAGVSSKNRKKSYAQVVDEVDLNAKVQTGPGIPQWKWRQVYLSWNGPVDQGQTVDIVFLSPGVNKVLNIVGVILLAIFSACVIRGKGILDVPRAPRGFATGMVLIPLLLISGIDVVWADIPDQTILQQLQEKLLLPPECLPSCAQIQLLKLKVSPSTITVEAEIHAEEMVAIPAPVPTGGWIPRKALLNRKHPVNLFRTEDQMLWINVEKGISTVVYSGSLPIVDRVKIPLPLRPHRILVESAGWLIEGINENGRPDAQLQLTRIDPDKNNGESVKVEAQRLPPFFRVERTLFLGIEWSVETRIVRLSNLNDAIIAKVPLLPGEAVTSSEIRVENSMVIVNLPPGQKSLVWRSTLDQRESIELKALKTTEWIEVWRVNSSPVWHMEYSGIPVVYQQNEAKVWTPEWRPWPNEMVTLTISRPEAVKGRTLTIDDSNLKINLGIRSTDTLLEFSLRSSQGGQHTIGLPTESKLLSVAIDGRRQPIRLQGSDLILPVRPGKQVYVVNWRQTRNDEMLFRSGPVVLNTESVNSRIALSLGNDRWVLSTGGPLLGPAVLFWGFLVIIVGLAFALGRYVSTPLGISQWFLLLVGLSQVPVEESLIVIGWLLALSFRKKLPEELSQIRFNSIQIVLAILTLGALTILFYAVSQGLLGIPSMQVAGNGSSAFNLNWYADRVGVTLPQVWVFSVAIWIYHLLMLFWALWLALSLLRWLQWGWECFSDHGIWRKIEWKKQNKR